ncbi:hypothetical protein Sjap_023894 [Stephania japonica]|uniref:Secreted protein n=1 Tax=Stephania japonica TaxID=461633 RepID=A0AAP0HN74_9MAGN
MFLSCSIFWASIKVVLCQLPVVGWVFQYSILVKRYIHAKEVFVSVCTCVCTHTLLLSCNFGRKFYDLLPCDSWL